MEFRHLRYFAAVAEARNLTGAAKNAHVAQPALSRAMQDLEKELGVKLFERHARGVSLTLAGEAFAQGAARILVEVATAFDRADAVAGGRRGRLVMGAMLSAIATGIPTQVEDLLRREHPEVTLVLKDSDPPDITEGVLDGTFDLTLAVESGALPTPLVSEPLWADPVDQVLVPARHPLARRDVLTIPDLASLPFVLPQRTMAPGWWQTLLADVRELGLRSPLLVIDGGLRDTHFAVAAGRGWAAISRARAHGALPQGTVAVPVKGLETVLISCVIWRRGDRRPVLRTAIDAVIATARALPDTRVRAEPTLPQAILPKARRRRPGGTLPPAIEVRHLRALLAVAATQTIGRAAERLGITQPALSRQLGELEHASGLHLLERSARGVQLTAAGTALAGDCPALLLELERILLETTRARRGMEGRCVIAAVPTATTGEILSRLVAATAEKHPHLHLMIEEMATPLQVAAIRSGEIDLGLAHSYPALDRANNLRLELLQDDRVDAALVSATGPLAGRKRLVATDLADVPFLFMERTFHAAFYDRIMSALRGLGLEPRVEGTYDGLRAVWSLAAQGKGWCLGFRSQSAHPPSGTVALPIAGFDVPWGITLIRRRTEPGAAVRAVLDVLKELGRGSPKARRRSRP
ncbi:MAG TPA: LysR substrate-binding domain-containing protein [Gemmatimonadales bacterium]|nr:LysR substrate-binding domain-containing protein [Gemmatimonadales bacterium]